jgi:hypothetical protein
MNRAGTTQAGTNRAGPNRAATSQAGTSQAGTSQAGTNQAGTNRAAPNQAGASRLSATQDDADQSSTTQASTDATGAWAAAKQKQDAAPHTAEDGGRPGDGRSGGRGVRPGSTRGGPGDDAAAQTFGSSQAEGIGGFVFESSMSKAQSSEPDQTWGDEVWSNFQTPAAADSFGLPATGRRIEPSPPRRRSRLIPGLLIGLLIGLLLFGSAGWFVGRTWATTASPASGEAPTAEPTAEPTATASAAPSPTLGIFEQSQIDVNRPDFANSALGTISEGWLPYLSNCSRSGRSNGPALGPAEKVRVRCTLDGMTAIFVEYRSIEDRDRARAKMIAASVGSLAPGIESAPDQRSAPSGRTEGNYVEYAFRLTEQGTTRTVNGMWWDDAKTPIAGYLLAFWKDGLGERWEPMRDLWSRYA